MKKIMILLANLLALFFNIFSMEQRPSSFRLLMDPSLTRITVPQLNMIHPCNSLEDDEDSSETLSPQPQSSTRIWHEVKPSWQLFTTHCIDKLTQAMHGNSLKKLERKFAVIKNLCIKNLETLLPQLIAKKVLSLGFLQSFVANPRTFCLENQHLCSFDHEKEMVVEKSHLADLIKTAIYENNLLDLWIDDQIIPSPHGYITDMATTHDGRVITTSFSQNYPHERLKTLRILTINTNKTYEWNTIGHTDADNCVITTMPDSSIVTGDSDGIINQWTEQPNGRYKTESLGHTDSSILSIATTHDGKIITSNQHGMLELWTEELAKTYIPTLIAPAHTINSIAVTQNNRIITKSLDGTIKIWAKNNNHLYQGRMIKHASEGTFFGSTPQGHILTLHNFFDEGKKYYIKTINSWEFRLDGTCHIKRLYQGRGFSSAIGAISDDRIAVLSREHNTSIMILKRIDTRKYTLPQILCIAAIHNKLADPYMLSPIIQKIFDSLPEKIKLGLLRDSQE